MKTITPEDWADFKDIEMLADADKRAKAAVEKHRAAELARFPAIKSQWQIDDEVRTEKRIGILKAMFGAALFFSFASAFLTIFLSIGSGM